MRIASIYRLFRSQFNHEPSWLIEIAIVVVIAWIGLHIIGHMPLIPHWSR